ncbi:MAG: protein translocase subunit SecD [Lachnospiraceae bacterium]|nr:protein translocase subunit SecD [Lachnospiraceae bacterium]
MKDKKHGALALIVVLLAIALCGYGTLVGFTKAHKLSAQNIKLGLDLNGGVSITYEAVGKTPTETEMKDTQSKMQKRAEVYSTESSVVLEGSKRIVIDIPGAKDAEKVLKGLGKAGALDFVNGSDVKVNKKGKATYDKDDIILSGSDIKTASADTAEDETTKVKENVVNIEFNDKGTEKFADASKEAYAARGTDQEKNKIYIIYDKEVLSAPGVNAEITDGKCQISGGFDTFAEAEELATGIRIGALPVELKEVQSQVVDAQLGQNALKTGITAGIIGFILVVLFMIVFYRLPGVASSIALVFFIALFLVILNALNVTLTLPGIAGVLLNIGMAVDANVIIFSRIKEELGQGKTVQSSIKQGFSKALSAILDGNITTLIAAAVLYARGSGTVKGFAITLAIGIILSMFTALTVTRLLLNALCVLGVNDIKFFGVTKKRKTIDFISKKNIFFAIGGAFIIATFVCLGVNSQSKATSKHILNYGLEFMGGTNYTITFNDDTKIDSELKTEVEKIFKSEGKAKEVVMSKVANENRLQVHSSTMSESMRNKVCDAIYDKYDIDKSKAPVEVTNITGSVSGEMRQNAIIAVIIAVICMLIYIAFRFKDFTFAGTAVLALIHDICIVLFIYAAVRISVGSTFIAVMLTILGYSINSTIVIFDRVRENLKGAKRTYSSLKQIVNQSITDTVSRSINTNLTTFIMLATLAIFGVTSIREFAIPLMVGVVAGTYSSVFITAPLWFTIKTMGMNKEDDPEPVKQVSSSKKKVAAKVETEATEVVEDKAEAKPQTTTNNAPKKKKKKKKKNNRR